MLLLAQIISFISNPIFIITPIPFILVYTATHSFEAALFWTMFSFVFLLLVALFIFVGVRRGFFTDLDVSKREQRPLLFLVSMLASMLYLFGLFLFHAPRILFIAIIGAIVSIVVISIINLKIKASIHVATITVVLMGTGILYGGYFLLTPFLIPIIAWSRIKTKRHTPQEAIVGCILGITLILVLYVVLRLLYRL